MSDAEFAQGDMVNTIITCAGGQPQTFPDFTGCRWFLRTPKDIMYYD